MKTLWLLAPFGMFIAACASSTVFRSIPAGANVYVAGRLIGTTPVTYMDRGMSLAPKTVTLEKEGYQTKTGFIQRDELHAGPILSGMILPLPGLWAFGYPKQYVFDLQKSAAEATALR